MPKIAILADLLSTGHVEQFDRHAEFDVLVLSRQGEHLDRLDAAQRVDHVADHDFGRRGTRCNADNFDVLQPFRLYFTAIGDQMGGNAGFDADFTQIGSNWSCFWRRPRR